MSRRPRILSYTSGRWPCGVASYQANLASALAEFADIETVRLPNDRVLGVNLLAILKQRRLYQRLASCSAKFDAVLMDYTDTFWNGSRLGENFFPAFCSALRAPATVIVHELPGRSDPAEVEGSLLYRGLYRAAHLAMMAVNTRSRDYERYLRTRPFTFAHAVVTHSESLLPRDRGHLLPGPVYRLAEPEWTPREVDARFGLAGKTALLVFGFPQPSKGFDRAIACLTHLPEECVLVQAGYSKASEPAGCELVDLAAKLGVAHRFIRTGSLSDSQLSSVLKRTDLALVPFRSVHHSSSLGHLISAALPILASRQPTIERVANDGAGIAFADFEDPAATAGTIRRMLANPTERDRLCAANAAYAKSHGFREFAKQLLSIMNLSAESRGTR